ncbi:MAG TPA: DAK2 domain-containing protein [Desulfobacteria bacterium]|nr:DAK2 domain-containing protein [Desulfobacteria bacterium]
MVVTDNINGNDLIRMLASGLAAISKRYKEVDLLNVFPVPDGDTGTNMFYTMSAAVDEAAANKSSSAGQVAKAASQGALMGARGNSGVILSQLLRGFAQALLDKETITAKEFAIALVQGVDVAVKAVMKPVEGTILTVAREASRTAVREGNKNQPLKQVLLETCKTAESTLLRTPDLLPVLKEAGVVDAGGMGWFIILQGFFSGLFGESKGIGEIEQFSGKQYQPAKENTVDVPELLNPYCTEVLLKPVNADAEGLKEELMEYGDSILAAASDGLFKVHIHTARPNEVIGICLRYGSLSKVKIENMNEQIAQEEQQMPKKPFGIISVASGEGITGIMKSLGADDIISGGQSMNPSISQILDKVEKLNSDTVIILPNNSNIILSANQVPEMTGKTVHVIPTKTIPEGVAALLSVSPEMDPLQAVNTMDSAKNSIKTGEVTYAVRDTTINSIEIKKGNAIGLFEDKVTVGENVNDTVFKLLDEMISPDSEVCTIYFGEMTDNKDAEQLAAELSKRFREIDIELLDGGQPVYYYLISVE